MTVSDCGFTLSANEPRDFLELLDDRYDISSTVITSQLEPTLWHAVIGDVTIADSICDRLVHNAQRFKLTAKESVRRDKEKKSLMSESG